MNLFLKLMQFLIRDVFSKSMKFFTIHEFVKNLKNLHIRELFGKSINFFQILIFYQFSNLFLYKIHLIIKHMLILLLIAWQFYY